MIETPKIDLYLARVSKVIDRETYEIEVEIPGYGIELPAYPLSRGDMDEPVVGNLVIILTLDPTYHTVNFYTKLKENDFNGIRCNGKILDMTPESVVIGSTGKEKTFEDQIHLNDTKPETAGLPERSYIKMDDDGNIEVFSKIDTTITVNGNCTIICPNQVEITGGGILKVKGNVPPKTPAPFNCLTNCLLTGAVHQGELVIGI